MVAFLIALSVVAWVVSIFNLNGMTAAAVSMAFACWCGILARMWQAGEHQQAIIQAIKAKTTQ